MPNARGTPPTQMRLTPDDLARLDAIRAARRLPSRSAAVRDLIEQGYNELAVRPAPTETPRAPHD